MDLYLPIFVQTAVITNNNQLQFLGKSKGEQFSMSGADRINNLVRKNCISE